MILGKDPDRRNWRRRDGVAEHRNATDLPWRRVTPDGRWRLATGLTTGDRSELYIPSGEVFEAADGLDRVMTYVWQNDPDDDLLVFDPETNAAQPIPPERVSGDVYEVDLPVPSPVRVQCWEGRPARVWGPA